MPRPAHYLGKVSSERRTLLAFVLSLLAHPLLAGAVILLTTLTRTPPPKRPVNRPVSLRTIDSKQWASNRGRNAPPLNEPPAPLHPKGQVVDVAPGNNRVAPDAKYLAETNNRVEKETRAREQSQKYSIAKPKNSPNPEAMPVERGRAGGSSPSPVSAASRLEALNAFGGPRPRLSELMHAAALGHSTSNVDSNDQHGAMASAGDEARGSDSTVAAEGGGAPNDDLRDVEKGEGTFLNTREWKYASFFNRVKQAVSAHWDPNGRMQSKGNNSIMDRTTVVQVALRPDGSLVDIFVTKSCGLDYLDQEAIKAFERAQPFANPPAALVENGYIRFTFGFNVVNEGLSMQQLFRPPGR